jgi:transcription termination/antitermination protein NusG
MKHWKVLFVKPRTEKKVAEYCKLYGIDFYLPMREHNRVVQRRKISVEMPLFPGYVFVRLLPSQKLPLQQTNLLVRILEPSKPREMLRNLVMIRRALRANPGLTTTKPLVKGRYVRIVDGPFQGIEGRVARLTSKMKVVLNIDMIGQATAVEIESEFVEVLD